MFLLHLKKKNLAKRRRIGDAVLPVSLENGVLKNRKTLKVLNAVFLYETFPPYL